MSSAASESRQAAVDVVARMSGERWLAERPPASGQIGQVDDLHAGTAGTGGEAGHGGERRLGGFGQCREHREVADDPALALDEEHGRGAGVAHRVTARGCR